VWERSHLEQSIHRSTATNREPPPKLVELTDHVLFDDIWERKELSKQDRSLITVAALIALKRPDQLRFHLARAVENVVTEQELIEAITHLAFYAGWPSAMTAILIAKEVFSNREDLHASPGA
jgi:4-carboxymuconolactone decarboxylase